MYLLPLRIHVYSTGREGEPPKEVRGSQDMAPGGHLCSSGPRRSSLPYEAGEQSIASAAWSPQKPSTATDSLTVFARLSNKYFVGGYCVPDPINRTVPGLRSGQPRGGV